jgi:hypothetical protein
MRDSLVSSPLTGFGAASSNHNVPSAVVYGETL